MARQRGPLRKPGSSQKQRCAYHLCRSKRDVKNSKWCLPVRQASSSSTRKLHCKAKKARFCCEEHRRKAKSTGAVAKKPYGQRESLTQQQVTYLFDIMLHKVGCAWAAVMLLLSVSTGERVVILLLLLLVEVVVVVDVVVVVVLLVLFSLQKTISQSQIIYAIKLKIILQI